eukprot:607344-Alexandrium_andersonii.AAC.1
MWLNELCARTGLLPAGARRAAWHTTLRCDVPPVDSVCSGHAFQELCEPHHRRGCIAAHQGPWPVASHANK